MAAVVYPKALIAFLKGQINLETANIKAALIDQADEAYNAADEFLSDVTGAGIVATSGNLTSKTLGVVADGVFDAANINVPGVSGDTVEAVIVYVDTGTAGTSRLLAYLDGVTLTPNGGGVDVNWNASGILAI